MTWLLRFIPGGSTLWMLAGAAFVTVALWGGIQTKRLGWAKAEIQEVKNACALERANATSAALKQSQEYRAEEQRRAQVQQEKIDAAEKVATQARADAAIADAASGRLSARVAALVAQARATPSHPAASQPSETAGDAIAVLAELQRRADDTAGELARIADERGTAGQLCVAAYDSLEVKATP